MNTTTTEIYTLSLHDALPISWVLVTPRSASKRATGLDVMAGPRSAWTRSEEHTSELQSLRHLVCRLLLEKKKENNTKNNARVAVTKALASIAAGAEHTLRTMQ